MSLTTPHSQNNEKRNQDNQPNGYRGRFAPSPTGKLHFGSLVTAIASYLQAKKNSGQWFIRIDDVDQARVVKGAADNILKTLGLYGFQWDHQIVKESDWLDYYQQALQHLIDQQLIYFCKCSRKQIKKNRLEGAYGDIYPGTCQFVTQPHALPYACRVQAIDHEICFEDAIYGAFSQNIKQAVGDFVVFRSDGCFAYQLAVVVDDYLQKITEVVRGVDLLDSTPRQIFLQKNLGYVTPEYMHVPIVLNESGTKLSKYTQAPPLESTSVIHNFYHALIFLAQSPPESMLKMNLDECWSWAVNHWDAALIQPRLPTQ